MAVRIYKSSWKDDLYLMQQLKEQFDRDASSRNINLYETRFQSVFIELDNIK